MIDLTFFKSNGYQVLRQVFAKKLIQEIALFLKDAKDKTVNQLLQILNCSEKQLIPNLQKMFDQGTVNQFSHEQIHPIAGMFLLETRLDPILKKIPFSNVAKEIYQNIFPERLPRMHYPPMGRFVLPNNPFARVPPHQDISYNSFLDEFFVLWVPFNDIYEKKGGVLIYEGTQHLVPQPVKQSDTYWLEPVEIQGSKKVHFNMEMGDALLLNQSIVHESMPNLSDSVRYSIDFRFFKSSTTRHYLDIVNQKVVGPEK